MLKKVKKVGSPFEEHDPDVSRGLMMLTVIHRVRSCLLPGSGQWREVLLRHPVLSGNHPHPAGRVR